MSGSCRWEDARFDLIVCRFVLLHVHARRAFVNTMLNRLSPDGTLVMEEPSLSSLFSIPAVPAFEQANAAVLAYGKAHGLDYDCAEAIWPMPAGLEVDIQEARFSQPTVWSQAHKEVVRLSFQAFGPRLVEQGILEPAQVAHITASLARDYECPAVISGGLRTLQVALTRQGGAVMRGLKVEQVSQGIYERIPSEDVVGYRVREDSLLAWAIDGASTLTEAPFTTFSDVTDAGWFARQLSSLLQARFRNMPFSTQLLRLGLRELGQVYRQAGGEAQPLWAWPGAAATVVEIDFSVRPMQLLSYRYADCFVTSWHGGAEGLRPDEVAPPAQAYAPWKPYSASRVSSVIGYGCAVSSNRGTSLALALTLNPESALGATVKRDTLHRPGHVLLGSDGLSRIWDTYQLMTREQAVQHVACHGLSSLL